MKQIKKEDIRELVIGVGLIVIGAISVGFSLGYKLGKEEMIDKQQAVVKATFAPIEDCLREVRYGGNGRIQGLYWTVTDLRLHNDGQLDRNCDKEVGVILHKFINNQPEK